MAAHVFVFLADADGIREVPDLDVKAADECYHQ